MEDKEFKVTVQTPVSIELSRGKYKTRYLPPNPNLRMNWRERWKWSKEWKAMAYWAVMPLRNEPGLRGRFPWPGKVTVQFVFMGINIMDDDNARASCKPMIDGLTMAGIIKDDSREYINNAGVEWVQVRSKKDQGVELILKFHEHEQSIQRTGDRPKQAGQSEADRPAAKV